MGMTRKVLSVSTLGLVDFRSDKERTAAYTRGARREARKQTKLMRKQAAAQSSAPPSTPSVSSLAPGQSPAASAPPGWFVDPNDSTLLRWWDGRQWTEQAQPRK